MDKNGNRWRYSKRNSKGVQMYSIKRKLLSIDVGADKRLKLNRLLAFSQELSIKEMEGFGYSINTMDQNKLLFVIGKQRFIIHELPLFNKEIEMTTWSNKNLKSLFPKHYRMEGDHKLYIEGVAIWSLIHSKSRQYIPSSDFDMNITGEEKENELSFPRKLIPPKLKLKATLQANYSNCDMNGHINNASYIDFILGLIPISYIKNHTPKMLEIDYEKEIKLGTSVEVRYGRYKDAYWFYSDSFTIKLTFMKNE